MKHTCSTLLIHCMDFRLGRPVRDYLENAGLLGDCDIVSVAGAAKNIARPEQDSDRELLLRQIGISTRAIALENPVK